jgi:dTDP-4-amino-4,6-dideoxy-D-galactose acyltransferase
VIDPCEFLDWDTEYFGLRIGRVVGNTLTAAKLKEIDDWSERSQIRCLYFLARTDDPETTFLAETHGFHLVDMRVTFERLLLEPFPELADGLRLAQPADMPILEEWAQTGFTASRFFFDRQFSRERAAALYAVWLRRDNESPNSAVIVFLPEKGCPVGYISLTLKLTGDICQIGLIGVGPEGRGKGAGQTLVNGALTWAAQQGARRVIVVTQGRNIAAQRLYERCGFMVCSIELWYHKWYPEIGSDK